MRLLFGKPLHEASIEDVETFLAEAGEEGLTWEAKGNKQPHRDAVRKAVAGFANAIGGYLIIGAESSGPQAGWTLPGVTFRADEPGTWTSSVITSGMSPVPRFEVEVFERPDGRSAVVIEVQPIAVPPCITDDGILYQRVSGQTLPVTDQNVLAGLLRRGEGARLTAEQSAARAAQRALDEPGLFTAAESLLSVAISPVIGPEDKAGVLFSREFVGKLEQMVTRRLQVEAPLRYGIAGRMHQDAFRMWTTSREMGAGWTAAGYWDGSCAAVFSSHAEEWYVDEQVARINQGWKVLADIATELGGEGDAHLVVRINDEHASVRSKLPGPFELRRWTSLGEPSSDELASVEREIQRAFGRNAWEG